MSPCKLNGWYSRSIEKWEGGLRQKEIVSEVQVREVASPEIRIWKEFIERMR
jgi:hypothetical protein